MWYNTHMKKIFTDPRKVILTDCDGVLLDWEYSFKTWMFHRGYDIINHGEYKMSVMYDLPHDEARKLIRQFNESAAIGFLPPLRDAVYYIRKLHDEYGFVFHCLTSLSNDPSAKMLRTMNLEKVFGTGIFERVVCADTGSDKHELLEPYRNSKCLWVEDKPENAILGDSYGLTSVLFGHDHNAWFDGKVYQGSIPRVWKWKHIYDKIVAEELIKD